LVPLSCHEKIAAMKAHHVVLGFLALTMLATAGFASTSNIVFNRRSDFFAQGRHEFYLWCANGQDRITYQDGVSAKDARTKLSRKADLAGCQAVWQGRIAL
jgi:hypothetical protein